MPTINDISTGLYNFAKSSVVQAGGIIVAYSVAPTLAIVACMSTTAIWVPPVAGSTALAVSYAGFFGPSFLRSSYNPFYVVGKRVGEAATESLINNTPVAVTYLYNATAKGAKYIVDQARDLFPAATSQQNYEPSNQLMIT